MSNHITLIHNLAAEIDDQTYLIPAYFNQDYPHNYLDGQNYADINNLGDITKIVEQLAQREIDLHQAYPNVNAFTALEEAIGDLWNDETLRIGRISKQSNLIQWLLHWYGMAEQGQSHAYQNMAHHIRSYYATFDAIYYCHGTNYDAIDMDLLGGDGSGQYLDAMLDYLNQRPNAAINPLRQQWLH